MSHLFTWRIILTAIVGACVGHLSAEVRKPHGTFASSGAFDQTIYEHSELKGVLVRVLWSEIEPSPGVFNFTAVNRQIAAVEQNGKPWSLAVIGGGLGSPEWLTGELGAPYFDYSFRGESGYHLPHFWNATVQGRLAEMAQALGTEYGSNPNLALVYVTQMTSNGIEGHLQGVDMNGFTSAGYTDQRWIDASCQVARAFAAAFPEQPLAFEVHNINGAATVPKQIINTLWNDASLEHRVGAAIWWISGRTSYQSELIEELKAFPGDVYGQVIARSDQTERIEAGTLASVFSQAREIGMRYIEPWEYEFKNGENGANGTWDMELAAYNAWSEAVYGVEALTGVNFQGTSVEGGFLVSWLGAAGATYHVEKSPDLSEWDFLAEKVVTTGGNVAVTDTKITGLTSSYYRLRLVDVEIDSE